MLEIGTLWQKMLRTTEQALKSGALRTFPTDQVFIDDGGVRFFVRVLAALEERLARRHHAVIVVAEGAGQDILKAEGGGGKGKDASGNLKYADIGLYLKERIQDHFAKKNMEINLKYIDPSYLVRSAAACPTDSVYCERLGKNAAHAAMAGKTMILIGMVKGEFVHLPIAVATASRNHVDPEGALWRDAVDATQQPFNMKNLE